MPLKLPLRPSNTLPLAKLSNGKVFDGRNGNLSGIFREVKGYN